MNEEVCLDHIYLFAPPWGPVKHRSHYLMRALIANLGTKVLYIEDTGEHASMAWFPPWRLQPCLGPYTLQRPSAEWEVS